MPTSRILLIYTGGTIINITHCAIAKLMLLLGHTTGPAVIRDRMSRPL